MDKTRKQKKSPTGVSALVEDQLGKGPEAMFDTVIMIAHRFDLVKLAATEWDMNDIERFVAPILTSARNAQLKGDHEWAEILYSLHDLLREHLHGGSAVCSCRPVSATPQTMAPGGRIQ